MNIKLHFIQKSYQNASWILTGVTKQNKRALVALGVSKEIRFAHQHEQLFSYPERDLKTNAITES